MKISHATCALKNPIVCDVIRIKSVYQAPKMGRVLKAVLITAMESVNPLDVTSTQAVKSVSAILHVAGVKMVISVQAVMNKAQTSAKMNSIFTKKARIRNVQLKLQPVLARICTLTHMSLSLRLKKITKLS